MVVSNNRVVTAFLDESWGYHSSKGDFLIIAATIYRDFPDQLKADYSKMHLSQKPFKASSINSKKKFQRMEKMIEWNGEYASQNFRTVSFNSLGLMEVYRQIHLCKQFHELSNLGVQKVILDSRLLPDNEDPHLINRRDVRTFDFLRSDGFIPRDMQIEHLLDDEEILLSSPDLIAWCCNQYLKNPDSRFWKKIKNISIIELP
jgi:hypothetical protein